MKRQTEVKAKEQPSGDSRRRAKSVPRDRARSERREVDKPKQQVFKPKMTEKGQVDEHKVAKPEKARKPK